MKKLSKKGVLLFVGAMAVCAFVMPAMSSAATWGVVGTEHTLHSPNIGYSSTTALGALTSSCSDSTFTVDVRSANALTVTSARFGGLCTATGSASFGTCTLSLTATNNPDWTVTAPTTSNISIHGLSIDVTFQQGPAGGCAGAVGARSTITGTLQGGQWDATRHELIFNADTGLSSHLVGVGTSAVFPSGTIRDTQQTLTLG